jgi:hypothetical protein
VEEADLDKLIEGFSANITSGGGEVKTVEKMGRRRLAYTVRKFNDGFYVLLTVGSSGQPDWRDRAPPARLRAGDQVHHRAHGRGREASGEGEGPARLQGEAQRAADCAAARPRCRRRRPLPPSLPQPQPPPVSAAAETRSRSAVCCRAKSAAGRSSGGLRARKLRLCRGAASPEDQPHHLLSPRPADLSGALAGMLQREPGAGDGTTKR